nr:oligosaccharide flippase family protein [Anaerolineae bacterium]
MTETPTLPGRFAHMVLRGAAFLGVTQYGLLAIGLVRTFILARIIDPAYHGVLTFSMATVSFLSVFSMELRPIVLADTKGNRARLVGQWVIETGTALIGLLLAGILCWVFPRMGIAESGESVWPVIFALLGIRLVFGITSTPLYILHRDIRQDVIARLTLAGTIAGLGLAVTMALLGYPLIALVVDTAVPVVVLGLGAWIVVRWKPAALWDRDIIRDILSFGFTLWTSGLLGKITFDFDDWLVGFIKGVRPAAFYGKAYSLAKMPMDVFAGVIGGIALSMYSQAAAVGCDVLTRTYHLTTWLLMRIVAWSSIVILAASEEIVAIMLGPGWEDSASLVRWMFLFVLGRPLFQNNAQLLTALRREKTVRTAYLVQAVFLLAVGPLAVLNRGAVGASLAVSGMMVLGVIASHLYVRREIPSRLFAMYALPLVMTILLSPLIYVLGTVLSTGVVVSLLVKGVLATVVFGAVILLLERRTVSQVIALVKDNLLKKQGDEPLTGR